MREKLRDALPLPLRLWLRRVAVASVRLPLRLGARAADLAERARLKAESHGLDLHEAWDLKARPRTPYTQQYGAADFLFLMDALSGRRDRMPDPDRPVRTSIILLCYNKIDLTFQCLRSLLREVDLTETEIVVVDNASADATRPVLDYFGGYVRAVHNEENLGFVHGNNRGAGVARGEYLLFLNNDTVVLPGWLDALVETADADPRVGVVGPMFIFPDWTLQEAGGIVWQSGDAYRYGWGRSPDDRRFNFAREVDYVTGASLLVRKSLFDRLGGFDRRYAPIYYEDVDLCFGARALGYKVVYQPLSRILHFEGATTGTDTGVGLKRYQVLNRQKFREKWREVLEGEQPAPDPRRAEQAANRKRGPYVLVCDDRLPTPDRDAGSARMAFILRALGEWARPVFVSLGKQRRPAYERLLWKDGIETVSAVELPRLLRRREFAAAILSRPEVARTLLKTIRRADPRLPVVYDMVDAHFVRLGRESALTGDAAKAREAERYRRMETALARAADLVWFASTADREAMGRLVPDVKGAVVPTVHRLRGRGLPFAERAHLLFVGNFAHRPNTDAVNFFVTEILPLVRAEIPGAQFLVVGDNAPPELAAHASEEVRLLGYVPDLDPLMASARVFVAPLRFGAGINGKLGEALAYGLPAVTTSIGAEGMGFADGEHALVADDAQDFAAAVVRAYNDPNLWQRLSDGGRRHVAEHLSPESVARAIDDSLKNSSRNQFATV
jgi:GT2 family glycosyltransferase/glycosyltransferase involved in cell wall biosynthesis